MPHIASQAFLGNLHPHLRAGYFYANPFFNDSATALDDSSFLQSETKLHVLSEAMNNFRKDVDMRWQFGMPPNDNARKVLENGNHKNCIRNRPAT